MNDAAQTLATKTFAPADTPTPDIVIDEVFPHAPDVVWKALTSGALIGRWMMEPRGFAPEMGNRFYFQTPPDGDWDGAIQCQILELIPNSRLVYTWCSGHDSPSGYVVRLDTVVSWTLAPVDGGTRVSLIHSGFVTPRNDAILPNIKAGWPKVIGKLAVLLSDGIT